MGYRNGEKWKSRDFYDNRVIVFELSSRWNMALWSVKIKIENVHVRYFGQIFISDLSNISPFLIFTDRVLSKSKSKLKSVRPLIGKNIPWNSKQKQEERENSQIVDFTFQFWSSFRVKIGALFLILTDHKTRKVKIGR